MQLASRRVVLCHDSNNNNNNHLVGVAYLELFKIQKLHGGDQPLYIYLDIYLYIIFFSSSCGTIYYTLHSPTVLLIVAGNIFCFFIIL